MKSFLANHFRRARRRGALAVEHLEHRQLLAVVAIEGDVWNDLDGDGVRDAGERGLADQRLILDPHIDLRLTRSDFDETDEPSPEALTTFSDADGHFRFDLEVAGSAARRFWVRVVRPSGWDVTYPHADGVHGVFVSPDLPDANISFGLHDAREDAGTVTGNVWQDWSEDGTRNAGEPGRGAAIVFLDANGNGARDLSERFAFTEPSGEYRIEAVTTGDYVAILEPNELWTQTAPSGSAGQSVSVASGTATADVDFASRFEGSPAASSILMVREDHDFGDAVAEYDDQGVLRREWRMPQFEEPIVALATNLDAFYVATNATTPRLWAFELGASEARELVIDDWAGADRMDVESYGDYVYVTERATVDHGPSIIRFNVATDEWTRFEQSINGSYPELTGFAIDWTGGAFLVQPGADSTLLQRANADLQLSTITFANASTRDIAVGVAPSLVRHYFTIEPTVTKFRNPSTILSEWAQPAWGLEVRNDISQVLARTADAVVLLDESLGDVASIPVHVGAEGSALMAFYQPSKRPTETSNTGSVSGAVRLDSGGSLSGLLDRLVFADFNRNGRHDPAEPSTRTSASGNYTLSDLPYGEYPIALEAVQGFTIDAASQIVNLSAVSRSATVNFRMQLVERPDVYAILGSGRGQPGGEVSLGLTISEAFELLALDIRLSFASDQLQFLPQSMIAHDLFVDALSNAVPLPPDRTEVRVAEYGVINHGGGSIEANRFAFRIPESVAPGTVIDVSLDLVSFNEGQVMFADLIDGQIVVEALPVPAPLAKPSAGGIGLKFSQDIAAASIDLYDGNDASHDDADVTLTNAQNGNVAGSLVWDAADQNYRFVKTGRPLAPGDYSLHLAGNARGIVATNGAVLDGDADGVGGGDATFNFTVAEFSGPTLLLPDFARAAGQRVDVDQSGGIPVAIEDAADARSVTFVIYYDPTLLDIAGAVPGRNLPPDWRVERADTSVPGQILVQLAGDSPLSDDLSELAILEATVRGAAVASASQVLWLEPLEVNGQRGSARGDEAVQIVSHFGDATGDETLSALDASLVARVAVGLDTGFDAYRLIDPIIVADITGDGTLSALDASYVARKAVGLPQPEIPDPPPLLVNSTIVNAISPLASEFEIAESRDSSSSAAWSTAWNSEPAQAERYLANDLAWGDWLDDPESTDGAEELSAADAEFAAVSDALFTLIGSGD
ncbi:MAG: hypothetical protein KDA42_08935 [Planctomycetales bacterium]|nr:hypothetical protein [Planctomycetales bacterium]